MLGQRLGDIRGPRRPRREARQMAGDPDARMPPRRMLRRQRLCLEHVQHRTRQMARIECRDQVVHHDQRTAPRIHDAGPRRQAGDALGVDQPGRLGRVGQQTHQDIGLGQEARQRLQPAATGRPARCAGVRAQPATEKPRPCSIDAARRPRLPKPRMPTRVCAAVRGASNGSHRTCACAFTIRGGSRAAAPSAARHTYSPIVCPASPAPMRTMGTWRGRSRIAREVIDAGGRTEDHAQIAKAREPAHDRGPTRTHRSRCRGPPRRRSSPAHPGPGTAGRTAPASPAARRRRRISPAARPRSAIASVIRIPRLDGLDCGNTAAPATRFRTCE